MTIEPLKECPCCISRMEERIPSTACGDCLRRHGAAFADHIALSGIVSYDVLFARAWYRAKGEQLRAGAAKADDREIPYEDEGTLTVCPGCGTSPAAIDQVVWSCFSCQDIREITEAIDAVKGDDTNPSNRRAVYLAGKQLRAEGKMPALKAKAETLARAAGSTLTRMGDRPWATGPIRILWCFTCKAAPGTHFGPCETPECDRCLAKRMPAAARFTAPVTTASVVPGNDFRTFTPASLARALFATDATVLATLARIEGPGAPGRAELVEKAWQRDEGGRRSWAEATAKATIEFEEIRK